MTPPPPAPSVARPTPPGGSTVRVHEEKREEEAAPESSQAFSAYRPGEAPLQGFATLAGAIVLAGAGARCGDAGAGAATDVATPPTSPSPPIERDVDDRLAAPSRAGHKPVTKDAPTLPSAMATGQDLNLR